MSGPDETVAGASAINLRTEINPGDILTRVAPGGPYARAFARVEQVTDELIVCGVEVDSMRTMSFNRRDGVDVNGRDYGWLELPSAADRETHADLITFYAGNVDLAPRPEKAAVRSGIRIWTPGSDTEMHLDPKAVRALLTMLGDRPTSLNMFLNADRLSSACEAFLDDPVAGRRLAEGLPTIPEADYEELARELKSIADAAVATPGAGYPDDRRMVRLGLI